MPQPSPAAADETRSQATPPQPDRRPEVACPSPSQIELWISNMSRGLTRSLVLLVALAAVALANIPNSIVLTQYGPVQGYDIVCD